MNAPNANDPTTTMRLLATVAALLTVLVASLGGRAAAADPVPAALGAGTMLVMIEGPDCPYCRKWERDIGPGYRASDEGRIAPLVKRMKGHADVAQIRGIAYTPTFILVDRGTEVGRIIGYAGPDFFWGELERLMKQANIRPGADNETRADLPSSVASQPAPAIVR